MPPLTWWHGDINDDDGGCSQPSPPFEAHLLPFDQRSLHAGGLVAYRTLRIPANENLDICSDHNEIIIHIQGSVIGVSVFQVIVIDWIENL